MSNNFQLVKTCHFNGLEFDCYKNTQEQNNPQDFWATREQIGQALEYENPELSIANIHNRHCERLDKFSTLTKLIRVEGDRTVTREVTVYSFRGLLEICRRSNQPKADAVMDFLYDIADEIRLTGSYNAPNSQSNLEAAKLLQNMIDNPAYPLNKRSRETITRYIFKLVTGEDLTDFVEKDNAAYEHKKEVFNNIRRLRKALHLTQEALASLLGINRHTVLRWENGTQKPCEEIHEALVKLFNRPIEEILSTQQD